MHSLFLDVGWMLAAVAVAGAGYTLLAALLVGRFMEKPEGAAAHSPAVTILKPLHRGEPDLARNLETFFDQDYDGALQIVFGVHDEADPAIDVVKALQARYPDRDTQIIANSALYGANAKISNLINMFPAARHDILVLSDSDIGVSRDWLQKVTGALQQPGVGLVTCLYTGECAEPPKLWSTLAAMGTSYDFLPNVVTGVSLGLAEPCMGSTIAFTRTVLEKIGGFAAFAGYLADDYEMGRAVRQLGLELAIPALGVSHSATETSATELFNHELRWTRTIRRINPAGHVGSIITFAFPLALMAAILLDFRPLGLAVMAVALAARLFLKHRLDRIFYIKAGPSWLLPLRDLLSFAVFVASLFGETVQWLGTRMSVERSGVISSDSVEVLQ